MWGTMGAAMRASAVPVLILLAVAGCDRYTSKLKDVVYGPEFEADYRATIARANAVLRKHFRKGLDPDLTNLDTGDLWTIWHYDPSIMYRDTTREKAHVVVEDLGNGRVRVGVSVVSQLNDNIDNPHSIEDARWVRTTRDIERSQLIVKHIARAYVELKPSEYYEEKRRDRGAYKELRKDLVDRRKDVDLEEIDEEPKK
jgi:hypothetical protein